MAENQENAVATLLIEPPEELNDNITTDQFSEDNETSKDNDNEVVEKVSNGAEWSHLVETGSPFWDVIPISCLLYTSPSPRDKRQSRMPSSA